jgi:hypothetical protein
VVIDGFGTGDAHHAAQCHRGDDGVIGVAENGHEVRTRSIGDAR